MPILTTKREVERVRRAGALVGALSALAAGCTEESSTLPAICEPKHHGAPCAMAEPGVEYPVALLSHCGVSWAYFAGRYWVIDSPQPEGNNEIHGVMSLVGDYELAAFRGDDGRRFSFKPAPSSFKPPPCY